VVAEILSIFLGSRRPLSVFHPSLLPPCPGETVEYPLVATAMYGIPLLPDRPIHHPLICCLEMITIFSLDDSPPKTMPESANSKILLLEEVESRIALSHSSSSPVFSPPNSLPGVPQRGDPKRECLKICLYLSLFFRLVLYTCIVLAENAERRSPVPPSLAALFQSSLDRLSSRPPLATRLDSPVGQLSS